MGLEIAQLGQPVLRQVAAEVPQQEIASPEFQLFLDDLQTTLAEAGGVGLAAPQVASGRRVFLAAVLPPTSEDEKPNVEVFINPRLSDLSEEKVTGWEGCLSFLELLVRVPRHKKLRIDYLDRKGEAKAMILSNFPARVIQHENDHLDGVLTIDRAVTTKDIIKASELDAVRRSENLDEDDD